MKLWYIDIILHSQTSEGAFFVSTEPQIYELTCRAQVDCERQGVGCIKNNEKTICTKCCNSTDLCNTPTTYSGNQSVLLRFLLIFIILVGAFHMHCLESNLPSRK